MQFPALDKNITILHERLSIKIPDPSAVQVAYNTKLLTDFPYWSKIWPAALALCEVVAKEKEKFAGKTVAEIGAGLAAPGIYAARFADEVLVTDYLRSPLDYVQLTLLENAFHNIRTSILNWKEDPPPPCDILLMSDLNYAPADLESLRRFIKDALHNQTVIYLSTPQRLIAKSFVESLRESIYDEWAITTEGVDCTVYKLGGSKEHAGN